MGYPSVKNPLQKFTWNDYVTWPDSERWEIVDGAAYNNMTPAPSVKHQGVVGKFYGQLYLKLKSKSCRPFIAPLDVVLSEGIEVSLWEVFEVEKV